MTKCLEKLKNPLFFGYFGPILPFFGRKKELSEKLGLINFYTITYHFAKNQKKLMSGS